MKELRELLKKLAEAFGPPGYEDEVREIVINYLRDYTDEIIVDKWGNVIGVKKGKSDKLKLMLAAHMDEIALMIKFIEKNGFLRFTTLGGWNMKNLLSQRVKIRTVNGNFIKGVVGTKAPHVMTPEEQKKIPEEKDLFIDIGATSKEEVEKLGIRPGCLAVIDRGFEILPSNNVVCKAFDDRSGVAAMLYAMKLLKDVETEATIYAVATVQEEVGLRGATISAFRINPTMAIALDVTIASDIPGVPDAEQVTKLGQGPAIKVLDRSRGWGGGGLIAHSKVKDFLIKVATEEKIPYQEEILVGGTTDATAIAFTREGVPAGVISIPCRYVHSPNEMINLNDLMNSAKLVAKACEKFNKEVAKEIELKIIR